MNPRNFLEPLTVALLVLAAACASAADPPPAKEEPVSFHRQIRPILQQKCQGCHQPAKQRGGLLLTSYEGAAKGGDNGPMWIAGKPAESRVVKHLKGIEDHAVMPEGETKLPDAQIALFETWIKQGMQFVAIGSELRYMVEKAQETLHAIRGELPRKDASRGY